MDDVVFRPGRRMGHIESIVARNVVPERVGRLAELGLYFTLSYTNDEGDVGGRGEAPSLAGGAGKARWHEAYCSEVQWGSLNPEWHSICAAEMPQAAAGGGGLVLCTIHATTWEEARQRQGGVPPQ
eukprot:CAMPEP_0182872260 /NCGR_PEP_ID=MMETSP0034_2-20130328/11600_1 /TAXON_ID=156128 /ORGANISM="Nephroselmis pyriformis, Strain CCMP717" /LENGTH=125 /DNA_ID=CAMNT_0025004845 /DNA_START=80 /DNA_END=454 /DNA_ORIENTATION=-